MESKSRYKRMDKSSHVHWIIPTFLALFFFSGGSFLLSSGNKYPYDNKLITSLGQLLFMISFGFYHMFDLRVTHGHCANFNPDSVYSSEHGITPGFTIALIGGFFMFMGQLLLLLAWYYDPAGMSITFLMLAGISPVTSIFSFIIFREKLSIIQIVGMIVSISGIVYIGVDNIQGSWVSYLCGVLVLFSFSFRNLAGRAMENKGLDVYAGGMIMAAGEVVTGVVLLVGMMFTREIYLFSPDFPLIQCVVGGVIVAYSQYFINQAIMTGNIGVVITIINSNGVVFLALDVLFNNASPSLDKLAACAVVIIGVVVLLFGDSIYNKLAKKNTESQIEVF